MVKCKVQRSLKIHHISCPVQKRTGYAHQTERNLREGGCNIEAMHLLQYRQDAHLYARVEAPTIVASSAQTRMRILND